MAEAQETVMVVKEAPAEVSATQEPIATPTPVAAEEQKKKITRKRPAKKTEKAKVVKSKRKTAVARASIRKGGGRIRVNGFDIGVVQPIEMRNIMLEPISVSRIIEEQVKRSDITVSVRGGGQSAQAQAVRGAIAKALSAFAESDTVRKEYMRYDRSLLVDDTRRVEPKKFKGPKARARFQKSYR